MMRIQRGSCTLDLSMIHSAPCLRRIKCCFFPQFMVHTASNTTGRDAGHASPLP